MVKAQEWLDREYPRKGKCVREKEGYKGRIINFGKSRSEITDLDIRFQNLSSVLDLVEFTNLKELKCSSSQLTSLDLKDCGKLEVLRCSKNQLTNLILPPQSNLKKIDCSDNFLTNLNWSSLDGGKLIRLDLANNNFPEQDLNFLDRFTNLWYLKLGTDNKEKINQNIYNRWTGSLEYLQNMSKLNILNIDNTDLNTGVEYLPESLVGYNKFTYSTQARPTSKVRTIKRQLDLFSSGKYRWIKLEFTEKEINSWLGIGLTVEDYDIANQWKKMGFDVQQTKEWVGKSGLKIHNYEIAKKWKRSELDIQQIKQWTEAGLDDYDIAKKWKELGRDPQQVKEWINIGLTIHDYEITNYFQNKKNLTPEEVRQENLTWKRINPGFTLQLQKDWVEKGFNYKQAKKLINEFCLTPNDANFVYYLLKQGQSIEEIINLDNLNELKARYEKFGLCATCQQPNTGKYMNYRGWCKTCNSQHFYQNFKNWTSGNPEIDKFIQKHQLNATIHTQVLEWIPYEKFTKIEYLATGGFATIYKTKWKEGHIREWDAENNQWKRGKVSSDETVVLKILNNSQNITTDFLQEVDNHKSFSYNREYIAKCYGISQDPATKNYIIVMQYMREGDLRQYLKENYSGLSFYDKLEHLRYIIKGLKEIHDKELTHRDFHLGNILKDKKKCYISDLGLCQPANEENQKGKVYGVLPYIAPEVLQEKPYTQAADIYSFSIIAYEIFSGLPAYYEYAHDSVLTCRICEGLRPKFKIRIPQLLEDLIKKCWDNDPNNRPSAREIERKLANWQNEIEKKKGIKMISRITSPAARMSTGSSNHRLKSKEKNIENFTCQLQEAEKYNQTLLEEIRFPHYQIHPQAIYTSRLIDTKSITKQLTNTAAFSLELTSLPNFGNNDQDLTNRTKRQLSLTSQLNTTQAKSKQVKIITDSEFSSEPMEIDNSWLFLFPNQDPNFLLWLQTIKSKDLENFADMQWVQEKITSGELDLGELKKEYQEYQQEKYQTQIETPPK